MIGMTTIIAWLIGCLLLFINVFTKGKKAGRIGLVLVIISTLMAVLA